MAMAHVKLVKYGVSLLLLLPFTMAQNGDGGAASGNIPANGNSGSIAGASGTSSGSMTLSTGASIAIALVVSVMLILGITTSVLFFIAKRRQWTMRETLRHSRRKVTTGLKTAISPLTPGRATFATGPTKIRLADEPEDMRKLKIHKKGQKNHGIGLVDVDLDGHTRNKERDLEKGEGSRVVMSEKKQRPKPVLNLSKSKRIIEEPKTPMFNKVFGRE